MKNKELAILLDLATKFKSDENEKKQKTISNQTIKTTTSTYISKPKPIKTESESINELFNSNDEQPVIPTQNEFKGKLSRDELEKEVIRQNTFGAKRWFVILFLIFIFGFLIFSFNFHIRQEVIKFRDQLSKFNTAQTSSNIIDLQNKVEKLESQQLTISKNTEDLNKKTEQHDQQLKNISEKLDKKDLKDKSPELKKSPVQKKTALDIKKEQIKAFIKFKLNH